MVGMVSAKHDEKKIKTIFTPGARPATASAAAPRSQATSPMLPLSLCAARTPHASMSACLCSPISRSRPTPNLQSITAMMSLHDSPTSVSTLQQQPTTSRTGLSKCEPASRNGLPRQPRRQVTPQRVAQYYELRRYH